MKAAALPGQATASIACTKWPQRTAAVTVSIVMLRCCRRCMSLQRQPKVFQQCRALVPVCLHHKNTDPGTQWDWGEEPALCCDRKGTTRPPTMEGSKSAAGGSELSRDKPSPVLRNSVRGRAHMLSCPHPTGSLIATPSNVNHIAAAEPRFPSKCFITNARCAGTGRARVDSNGSASQVLPTAVVHTCCWAVCSEWLAHGATRTCPFSPYS
jgi:hypothetical protein